MPEKLTVKVYTPHSSIKNLSALIGDIFNSLKNANQLGYTLAQRDIKSQYRQSFLGILWAFINPVFNTILWIFLTGSGIIKVSNTSIPYPLYVFIGTMLWGVFTESVVAPINQTNSLKGILTKINFPQEAIIISAVYQIFFNSIIKVGLVLVAVLSMGIYPDWHILLFPLGLLVIIFTGIAIGLMLTPIGVLYGDITRGLPLVLQMAMYVTPIVFPMPQNGSVAGLFKANPFTPLFINTRNWITGQGSVDILSFIIVAVVFLFLLFIAIIIFRIAMPILVERMSS